jgi:hypothetical protein
VLYAADVVVAVGVVAGTAGGNVAWADGGTGSETELEADAGVLITGGTVVCGSTRAVVGAVVDTVSRAASGGATDEVADVGVLNAEDAVLFEDDTPCRTRIACTISMAVGKSSGLKSTQSKLLPLIGSNRIRSSTSRSGLNVRGTTPSCSSSGSTRRSASLEMLSRCRAA